jgi:hypothetical protein
MNTTSLPSISGGGEYFPPAEELIEVALLLTTDQARALEEAAHRRNVSVGQLTRHLIKDFLTDSQSPTLRY